MKKRIQNKLRPGENRESRRGALLIFIVVFLMVFIGVIAFSIDIAYMHLARTELRTASDAAARAAGESLSRTQDINLARQAAKDIAAMNLVDNKPLILEDIDIVNGKSDKANNGRWNFARNATPVNSFEVTGRKERTAPSGSVKLFFAKLWGKEDYEIARSSTAARVDRDICLVVDRSSSMKLWVDERASGLSIRDWRVCAVAQPRSRWVALEGAVRVFLNELQKTPQREYVGLASYASDFNYCGVRNKQAEINQQLTDRASAVNSAMDAITNSKFNGNTAIGEGIYKGMEALAHPTYSRPFARKTIVLLTDGWQNNGRSPVAAAQDAKRQGIVIHTITFGDSANQGQMRAIAASTGGKHYHAPDEAALVNAFREIALSLSVILTN
ncbi:MAG: VWA domain-containing protein [Planctomycetaceae bacterium]